MDGKIVLHLSFINAGSFVKHASCVPALSHLMLILFPSVRSRWELHGATRVFCCLLEQLVIDFLAWGPWWLLTDRGRLHLHRCSTHPVWRTKSKTTCLDDTSFTLNVQQLLKSLKHVSMETTGVWLYCMFTKQGINVWINNWCVRQSAVCNHIRMAYRTWIGITLKI